MGGMNRTPPTSPTLRRSTTSGFQIPAGGSKRKLNLTPTKEAERSKVTVTDTDQLLSQEQKVDKILSKLLELEKKWEESPVLLEVKVKVDKIDNELERLRKDQISNNIIIAGVPEEKQEKYEDLEKRVEKVLGALQIGDVD